MDQKVGAVLIADDASLSRLGGGTAFERALAELSNDSLVREILVVSESEVVRRLAQAWQVRCLSSEDAQGVTWAQASTEPVGASPASIWPKSKAPESKTTESNATASPEASTANSPKTGLARRRASLDVTHDRFGALLAGLGLDVVVVIDASCPLWESGDLRLLVAACERANRSFLAIHAPRTWTARDNGDLVELTVPACVELGVLRGFRLRPMSDLGHVEPVLSLAWKGWSLREPTERLAIGALWEARQKQRQQERLPDLVAGLAMDFDGVFTDNRVLVNQDGTEGVWCHRGDGLGLELLRKAGVPMVVISKERNPVVQARCAKLGLSCLNGIDEKLQVLKDWCSAQGIEQRQLVFVGNDVNDIECLAWAGCGVAVEDSHVEVIKTADLVLERAGGQGALRELAEMILLRNGVRLPVRAD